MILPATSRRSPSALMSIVPVAALLVGLAVVIATQGAGAISEFSPYALLGASAVAVVLAGVSGSLSRRGMAMGLRRSAAQVLPAVPMLVCIALLATSWMLSGVVPILIDYGLAVLNPQWFLVTACCTCAVVSVLTGSSWSTIATIGVALLGIGTTMGYGEGWVAGAIISGAYFGDKVSPLSDTTVVASSTCGVDLFEHIRGLMVTSAPAMCVALLVFGVRGLAGSPEMAPGHAAEIMNGLETHFNLTPWVLVIPAVTAVMIALRVPTLITLASGAVLGAVGVFVFQSGLDMGVGSLAAALWSGNDMATGTESLDSLVSTGGVLGMVPTLMLVLSAMVFGWMLIGTGMLGSIAGVLTRRMRRRESIVTATVGSGIFANMCTADQYLSLIITGNMYRGVFRRSRISKRVLSRTIEDSVSVTSVLIPWNSCGVTQSTVLGVGTLTYLPYCVFNYLSPVFSILVAFVGIRLHSAVRRRMAAARG